MKLAAVTWTTVACALLTACGGTAMMLPPAPPAAAPPTVVIQEAVAPAPPAPPAPPPPTEAFRVLPRGDWALIWSETRTSPSESLGAPTTIVSPAPGARRVVVPRAQAPASASSSRITQAFPDTTQEVQDMFEPHSLLAVDAPVRCAPGDVTAFTVEEGAEPAELASESRPDPAVRAFWTPAVSYQTTSMTITAGKAVTKRTEGKHSYVFVEALAPGQARIRVRAGGREKMVVFDVRP